MTLLYFGVVREKSPDELTVVVATVTLGLFALTLAHSDPIPLIVESSSTKFLVSEIFESFSKSQKKHFQRSLF